MGEMILFDHQPIVFSISFMDERMDIYKTFLLNVSHPKHPSFLNFIKRIWNLSYLG